MNDLDIIKQLEQELGKKLEKLENIIIIGIPVFKIISTGYVTNDQGQVTELCLFSCEIKRIPECLCSLIHLRKLVIQKNKIEAFPDSFIKLKQLTYLDVSNNQLQELPNSFGQLKNLNELFLDENQLKELPESLGQLQNLRKLSLKTNKIRRLPYSLGYLHSSCDISLLGNPLEVPPIEIVEEGIEAIKNYFQALPPEYACHYIIVERSHFIEKTALLNEAKVLFVGQGGVGKTSLVKHLVSNTYNPNENKTDGINIENWTSTVNEHEVQLNLWDFGGQEIMHATHQFFLTKRSLYILVLDARQDEQQSRIEYWLKLIQSFGSDSPIIIVINKIDQHQLKLNKNGLQKKYAGIQAFIETSCQENQGINALAKAIQNNLSEMPHIHDALPATWFQLKQKLEDMNVDYISYEKYQALCSENNVTDSHQETLIGYLHDLGIVLNFREDKRLKDTNVLNPEWVTEGIYKLLNAKKLSDNQGVLRCEDLEILLGKPYQNKQQFIIDMMEKFELCFELSKNQYLIPDLLPKDEPKLDNWDYENSLEFQFHYDILPTSIMSRFIVKMHRNILDENYWFSGVILESENNQALVKSDVEDKKIQIWVIGNAKGKRGLLQSIREKLKDIHADLHKINAREIVIYQGVELKYQNLLIAENHNKKELFIPELGKDIPLVELLDGIKEQAIFEKTPEQLKQQRREDAKERREKIQLFINIVLGLFAILGVAGTLTIATMAILNYVNAN